MGDYSPLEASMCKTILYKLGTTITVTIISNMKLNPIIPKNKAADISFGLISWSLLLKKMMQKIAKIPVLTTGVVIEASIEPRVSWFFFKAIKTNPAAIPARVVFSKQVKIVPIGLIEKK